MNPLFSIVIPTYNRAHLIGKTIDSVLDQDYQNFEILIVDDGSKDNTGDYILTTYKGNNKVKYFYKTNGERGAARNYGLEKAEGEYVIFLDSDDLFRKDHLAKLSAAIIANPSIKFIAAKYDFDRNGVLTASDLNHLAEGYYGLEVVLVGNPFSCNFGVRKDNSELIKFREEREFVIIEDWVFLVENLYKDKIYIVDANTTILVDHVDRSMRADQSNIINKRQFALNWLLEKYEFTKEQEKKLRGYSYYFCAIHAYIDDKKEQGFAFLKKAISDLGVSKATILLGIKLFLGRKIFAVLSRRK